VTGGYALHFARLVAGDGLYYRLSPDMGGTWSTPLRLVQGDVGGWT